MSLIASVGARWENIIQMIVVLFVFLIVIGMTGLTTKLVGGYQKNQFANRNLKPIESMKVGNNKYIQLVKVGEVYLVLGIGKDEVHTIAKLTKDELPELINQDVEQKTTFDSSFQSILSKISNKDKRNNE